MKKLLFILTIIALNISYSQNRIQVRITDFQNSVYSSGGFLTSNNTSLATVLASYPLIYLEEGVPSYVFSDEVIYKVYNFSGYDPSQTTWVNNLLIDLNALSIVSDAAVEESYGHLNKTLTISLANPSIGSYINIIGGIVQTNNVTLNSIFQNYSVNKYEGNNIRCTCNVTNLKNALDNLTSIISNTYYAGIAVLSNTTFEQKKALVYPNPFTDNFEIDTNENVLNYEIYDFIGKKIISESSKFNLDLKIQNLKQGVYILNIVLEDKKSQSITLIKN